MGQDHEPDYVGQYRFLVSVQGFSGTCQPPWSVCKYNYVRYIFQF